MKSTITTIGTCLFALIMSFAVFSGLLWLLITCVNALNLGVHLVFTWKLSFLLWLTDNIIHCFLK